MTPPATHIALDSLYRAQFGEDRIIWRIFEGKTDGYFIEVGAFDGVSLSNTYFLEQLGWSGLLIEPILPLCHNAATVRPRSRVVQAACSKAGSSGTAKFTVAQNVPVLSFLRADQQHIQRCKDEGATLVEIEVPLLTLTDVLLDARRHQGERDAPWHSKKGWNIDLVSIDTEGAELDVLDGFQLERFKPRLLIIENDRPSAQQIEPYLAERGYRKIHRQKINDFYVRSDDNSLCIDGLGATD